MCRGEVQQGALRVFRYAMYVIDNRIDIGRALAEGWLFRCNHGVARA